MPPKPSLRLGPQAFSPVAEPSRRTAPLEIVDSHVHLFGAKQLAVMDWLSSLPEDDIRRTEHTLERYADNTKKFRSAAKSTTPKLAGYVYSQVEVRTAPGEHDEAVKEVESVLDAAASDNNAPPLLGIVCWAPLPEGPEALTAFLAKVYGSPSMITFATSSLALDRTAEPETAGQTPSPVKGCRWLLEFHPELKGASLQEPFIQGLKLLGKKGLVFEYCVQPKTQGLEVLDEVLESIHRVRDGQIPEEQTRFILDHLLKPDLTGAISSPLYLRSPAFTAYTAKLFKFALIENVYIKLSGLLAEAEAPLIRAAFHEWASTRPELDLSSYTSPLSGSGHLDALKRAIRAFLEPVLDSFGHERIIYGSDYPVFRSQLFNTSSIHSSPELDRAAYEFALSVYIDILLELGLGGEELDAIFAANARRAYGI